MHKIFCCHFGQICDLAVELGLDLAKILQSNNDDSDSNEWLLDLVAED